MNARPLLAALCLLALVPIVSAHGEDGDIGHLNVKVDDVGPQERVVVPLDPTEGPQGPSGEQFRAGWVFTLYGGIQGNGSLDLSLTWGNETISSWNWSPGTFQTTTLRLTRSGPHNLTLWNPSSSQTVRYGFYFDMSCNCASKLIPLPGGFVLFDYDLPPDRDVTIKLPTPQGVRFNVSIAILKGDNASWPNDFNVLTTTQSTSGQTARLEFPDRAAETTYYVFVRAPEGASLQKPADVIPSLDVKTADVPGIGTFLSLAALVVISVIRRRWP